MRSPRTAAALLLVSGLLAMGGCKSGDLPFFGDSKKEEPKASAAKADAKDDAKAAQPAASKPAASGKSAPTAGGDARLSDIRTERKVREEARRTLVAHYVKTGDAAFADSRFDEAETAYQNALDLDPDNDHARSRMMDIGAILGRRGLSEAAAVKDAVEVQRVRAQQAKAEVANLASKAEASVKTGDLDEAVSLYERALVIVQLYPTTVDFSPGEEGLKKRLANAKSRAGSAAEERRDKEIAEARQRARVEAAAERAARRSKLQRMFRDANAAMESGNYQLAQNLAEEILRADPDNESASRLRSLAFSALTSDMEDDLRKSLAEEWKHVFEQLAEAYTPQVSDYEFPDNWAEVAGRRRARGLSPAAAGIDDPASRDVRNRLEATRVAVSFEQNSIDEVTRYLSNLAGVNIVVLPVAREGRSDDELMIEQLQLESPVSVSEILDLITNFAGLAWNIEGGVVQITTPEAARGESVVQLYDVKDLATEIRNFPGEEVQLDPTGEFYLDEDIPDPEPEFLLDRIQELITMNVDPDVWDDTGSVEPLPPGTLVVKAPPSTHGKVQSLLDGLRGAGGLQVAIESRFVTVSDNFLEEVGVDLRGLGDQSGGVGVPGRGGLPVAGGITTPVTFDDVFFGSAGAPTGIGTGSETGLFYNLNSDGDIRGRFENLFDVALGKTGVLTNLGGLSFQGTLIDDTQLEVILRAVQKNDRSTVVVAPRLTAYNGQRANVTVLNQISYISDFDVEIAQASQIGDPIVQTLRDGVILDLRPTVSADRRFITMELRPTVALLTRPIATFQTTLANGPPVTIQLPELQIQRVRTTINMPDGGTLLLGGMKFFEERRLDSSVPWLNKIPIASFFLSRKGTYLEKRNLLVLIRARILRPEENEPGTTTAAR